MIQRYTPYITMVTPTNISWVFMFLLLPDTKITIVWRQVCEIFTRTGNEKWFKHHTQSRRELRSWAIMWKVQPFTTSHSGRDLKAFVDILVWNPPILLQFVTVTITVDYRSKINFKGRRKLSGVLWCWTSSNSQGVNNQTIKTPVLMAFSSPLTS